MHIQSYVIYFYFKHNVQVHAHTHTYTPAPHTVRHLRRFHYTQCQLHLSSWTNRTLGRGGCLGVAVVHWGQRPHGALGLEVLHELLAKVVTPPLVIAL